MSTLIYTYFEEAVIDPLIKNKKSYVCKLCKAKGIDRAIKIVGTTNSNLVTHMQTSKHEKEYEEYQMAKELEKLNKQNTPKRGIKRLFESIGLTPEYNTPLKNFQNINISNSITQSPKYAFNSVKQKERYLYAYIIFFVL